MQVTLKDTQVVVLAGGLGTRIAPVLGVSTPKLLAPVDGRPYLSYFIDWVIGFGVCQVTLCLGHLADAVIAYLKANPPPISIDWVVELKPLGTAGALRLARDTMRGDPVLVCNGDSFTDVNLNAFLAFHRQQQTLGSILCTEMLDTSRFGRVSVDAKDRITTFSEKGIVGPGYINAGCYFLSTDLLDQIAQSSACSLENDIFAKLPTGTLSAFCGGFRFIDIGTPESFRAATAEMLRHV